MTGTAMALLRAGGEQTADRLAPVTKNLSDAHREALDNQDQPELRWDA